MTFSCSDDVDVQTDTASSEHPQIRKNNNRIQPMQVRTIHVILEVNIWSNSNYPKKYLLPPSPSHSLLKVLEPSSSHFSNTSPRSLVAVYKLYLPSLPFTINPKTIKHLPDKQTFRVPLYQTMDSPFFTSQRSVPSHRRYYYSPSPVPVHHNPAPPRPKVVSIPVRFVDTERTQSDAALKIQSLYRGYLVRKSVQRIAAIGREVDEVQRRVEDADVVDLLRRDGRERLKVNERLMDLLFRLDSVRGIDSGVREYRKKVIRRAIALQEKVDAIAAAEATKESPNVHGIADVEDRGECESMKSEAIFDVVVRNVSQADDVEKEEEQLVHGEEGEATTGMAAGEGDISVCDGNHAMAEESIVAVGDALDKNMEEVAQPVEAATAKQRDSSLGDDPQTMDADLHANEEKEDSCADSETGSSLNPESLIDAADENKQEDVNTNEARDSEKSEREIMDGRNKALLERMVEDNEKMMALMAELFERNERQTRLLSSLSKRVEQLEKAFVCEKLRKKKKRQAACGGGTDGSETCQDSKHCGKR